MTYGPQTEGQENRMIRILIIEDDTDINNMTAEFLRGKGLHSGAGVFRNGRKASVADEGV